MITSLLLLALTASKAPAADTLAAAVAAAQRSGTPTWVAWTVPSAAEGTACCGNDRASRPSQTCSLESDNYGMNMSREDGRPADPTLVVYARVSADGVEKLRMYSASCQVDRGSARIQDIANVSAIESVRYLEGLVKGGDLSRTAKRRSDGAVGAIAMHDDKTADAALERIAKEGDTKQIRHSAAFWLGNTRAQAGYEAPVRLRSSEDASFRDHLTFAFS